MAEKDAEVDELLDKPIKGKTPEEILGESGLLNGLTRRLMERALEGEMTAHVGYESTRSMAATEPIRGTVGVESG
ncbi:MAG: hypothetical protein WEE89_19210 [Gemmatimonadota bacterium]